MMPQRISFVNFVVFFRLFEHAKRRSFVPAIMMIECTKVYLPVYGPTKQETLQDRSREVDEARFTSLSVRCKHATITIYLAS